MWALGIWRVQKLVRTIQTQTVTAITKCNDSTPLIVVLFEADLKFYMKIARKTLDSLVRGSLTYRTFVHTGLFESQVSDCRLVGLTALFKDTGKNRPIVKRWITLNWWISRLSPCWVFIFIIKVHLPYLLRTITKVSHFFSFNNTRKWTQKLPAE